MTPDTVVASSRRQNTVSDSQSLELEPENFPSHQVLLAWFGYPGCPRIDIKRVKFAHCLSVQSRGWEKEMGAETFLRAGQQAPDAGF